MRWLVALNPKTSGRPRRGGQPSMHDIRELCKQRL